MQLILLRVDLCVYHLQIMRGSFLLDKVYFIQTQEGNFSFYLGVTLRCRPYSVFKFFSFLGVFRLHLSQRLRYGGKVSQSLFSESS